MPPERFGDWGVWKDGSIYCIGSGKAQALKRYIETIRDSIDTKLKIGFGEQDYYRIR